MLLLHFDTWTGSSRKKLGKFLLYGYVTDFAHFFKKQSFSCHNVKTTKNFFGSRLFLELYAIEVGKIPYITYGRYGADLATEVYNRHMKKSMNGMFRKI